MSIKLPSLKVSGSSTSSGAKSRRTIVGVVEGFLKSEGSDVIDTVAIKVISPGGKMDGKIAHMKLEDIGEEGAKRTSIETRVPGKTEKVADPMNKGKYLDAPLKTDWLHGTVAQFEQAYFSGKGDGSPGAAYQMEARWSGTFSPEESRAVPVESAYVTRYEENGESSYSIIAPMPSQSILIPADQAGAAADEIANASRGEDGRNMGMTVMVITKDKGISSSFQVGSFMRVVEEGGNKKTEVPNGSVTLAETIKKENQSRAAGGEPQISIAPSDSMVIIPHQKFGVTSAQYRSPKNEKTWSAMHKITVDPEGSPNARASVIALSPKGIATSMATVGYARDFRMEALINVGLVEPKQYEEKSATMEDKAEKVDHEEETADEGMSPDNY